MTTAGTIGVVVRCGDAVSGIYATVASLDVVGTPVATVVMVVDPTMPPSANAWLDAFAQAQGFIVVRVDTTSPGRAWNAGLERCDAAEFVIGVEAGDTFSASALTRLRDRLATDSSLSFVATGTEWMGPGTAHSFSRADECSATAILANPLDFTISAMFPRVRWVDGTRFDETLEALEHTDFWLSLLGDGGKASVEPTAWLRRRVHARALYKRAWLTTSYASAASTVFERHRSKVSSVADLLAEKERLLQHQHRRHEALKARLLAVEAETAALLAQVQAHPTTRSAEDALDEAARIWPLSHDWGYDRGIPVDRPYIERFLAAHRRDIRGVVLEVQEDEYTHGFGGPQVTTADVVDINTDNTRATVIADLRAAFNLESNRYDCIILTQTLHVLDDMAAAVRECHRLLRAGGVVLATLPCASRVCLEYGADADLWRMTAAGARRLFETSFAPSDVDVATLGNSAANAAFAMGRGASELPAAAFDVHDPYFPLLVGVRARKARSGACAPLAPPHSRCVVLMYHRVSNDLPDPHRLCVTPPQFERQIRWLKETCSVIPLARIATRADEPLPDRSIALTFDDGCVDNLREAAPRLIEHSLHATFFLTTAKGSEPFRYWWDRLAALLARSDRRADSVTVDLPEGSLTLPVNEATYWRLYQDVLRLPLDRREAVMACVDRWAADQSPAGDDRRMTDDEVRRLAQEPRFDIGAHTVNHLFLPSQTDFVLKHEIADCRATLMTLTGRSVDTFAYPFGAFDARTVAAVRDAGYTCAVTCAGRNVTPLDDPLTMPRVEVVEEPLEQFIDRVEHALGMNLR